MNVLITNKTAATKLAADAPVVAIKKKTTKNGRFQVINVTEGVYEVQISKLWYLPQTVTINVIEGETAEAEVEVALIKA